MMKKKQNTTLLAILHGRKREGNALVDYGSRSGPHEVIGKFDAFFQVTKNVIFERCQSTLSRARGVVEQFITNFYEELLLW